MEFSQISLLLTLLRPTGSFCSFALLIDFFEEKMTFFFTSQKQFQKYQSKMEIHYDFHQELRHATFIEQTFAKSMRFLIHTDVSGDQHIAVCTSSKHMENTPSKLFFFTTFRSIYLNICLSKYHRTKFQIKIG